MTKRTTAGGGHSVESKWRPNLPAFEGYRWDRRPQVSSAAIDVIEEQAAARSRREFLANASPANLTSDERKHADAIRCATAAVKLAEAKRAQKEALNATLRNAGRGRP